VTTRISPCLMFAPDGVGAVEAVAPLLRQRGFGVTFSATEQACLELLGRQRWCLLILDADSDAERPLHLLVRCRTTYPDIPTLVLVRHDDISTAVRAMKAGAADCLDGPVTASRLLSTVVMLCEPAEREPPEVRPHLTKTERLVLHHVLMGRTSLEIAERLCRSPRTIDVHRSHIREKMNAHSLVDLVKRTMGEDGDLSQ